MRRLQSLSVIALAAGAVAGCQLTTPTSSRSNAGVNPTGVTSTAPPASAGGTPGGQLPPGGLGQLSNQQLAQIGYLVSSNAAGLTGAVSGPAQLVANNAAGLISNNAAGLVANNSGGLVASNAGAYHVLGLDSAVASGFVYLTTPDERFYLTPDHRLFSTVTDAAGNYTLAAPASDSVIVNVLLSGDRRLTAFASTTAGATASAKVDLATTLATEFLRYKASQWGFNFGQVAADPTASSLFGQIVADTETLLTSLPASGSDLGPIAPSDLEINNTPLLRQHYVVAFGTSPFHAVSDDWVALLKEIKHDPSAPDIKYRSLALTTVNTGIPAGALALGVAADPYGNIYVSDVTESTAEIRQVTPSGADNVLLVRARSSAIGDQLNYVGNLTTDASGDVLLPDTTDHWIGVLDPRKALQSGTTTVSAFDFAGWLNPELLVDTFDNATDDPSNDGALCATCSNSISNDDITLDDAAADPTGYFVDLSQNTLWEVPHILTQHETGPFPASADGSPGSGTGSIPIMLAPATGDSGATSATASTVPAFGSGGSTLASGLFLDAPSNVTFHRSPGGTPFLYLTDDGDHVILEINLSTGGVRQVVGALPAPTAARSAMPQASGPGARIPDCYSPASEQFVSPLAAHLRYPHKVLFDPQGDMIVADSDNQILRMVIAPYSADPQIVTIAGYSQYECDANNQPVDVTPPLFADGDGEANNVVIGEVQGMAIDPEGNLLLSDARSNRVRKLWLCDLEQ